MLYVFLYLFCTFRIDQRFASTLDQLLGCRWASRHRFQKVPSASAQLGLHLQRGGAKTIGKSLVLSVDLDSWLAVRVVDMAFRDALAAFLQCAHLMVLQTYLLV